MRIYALKQGALNEAERLELARLLIKAGYMVRVGKEKATKSNTGYYVEYIKVGEDDAKEKEECTSQETLG
jgi:hypothetical protein